METDILGVPALPESLIEDQHAAVRMQREAISIAHALGAHALGFGSALAVVGGRATVAAAQAPLPITTGHAATAWAAVELVRQVGLGIHVGVLGARSTVGDAIASLLAEETSVRVEARGAADHKRAAQVGTEAVTREALLATCDVIVGASTTGPILAPSDLRPGTVFLDLANPPSLRPGPLPTGVVVLAGETLAWPGRVRTGGWGHLWRAFAGYEGGMAYACLAEPIVLAAGLVDPPRGGRRLARAEVRAVGESLKKLGFQPRLHRRVLPRQPRR